MITREEDIDAHALHRPCWTISAIARHLGRDRKTIRASIDCPPPDACSSAWVAVSGSAPVRQPTAGKYSTKVPQQAWI